MEFPMVSITDLNIVPLTNLPKAYASDSIKAVLQGLNATRASNAFDGPASDAGTTGPTGFTAAPRLSADVIDALLKSQAEQSTGGASSADTAGQAATLSGASAVSGQTAPSSDPSSS